VRPTSENGMRSASHPSLSALPNFGTGCLREIDVFRTCHVLVHVLDDVRSTPSFPVGKP
jgi:hypothetical protein